MVYISGFFFSVLEHYLIYCGRFLKVHEAWRRRKAQLSSRGFGSDRTAEKRRRKGKREILETTASGGPHQFLKQVSHCNRYLDRIALPNGCLVFRNGFLKGRTIRQYVFFLISFVPRLLYFNFKIHSTNNVWPQILSCRTIMRIHRKQCSDGWMTMLTLLKFLEFVCKLCGSPLWGRLLSYMTFVIFFWEGK